MRGLIAASSAVLLLAAGAGCGGDPGPDDAGLHQAIVSHQAGAEVTFDAVLVTNPAEANNHERMEVRAGSGDQLEIDHNTALATPVPAHQGDSIVVHGKLYIDPGSVGVHCTHAHTSSGCPEAGWIKFQGNTYN
ncbi:MAG TPA: DUF3465 domain-containing protein [Candidatus Dormibacteraeota bacterium]